MDASMGACGDDEWDINIFFCDDDKLHLGPTGFVGQYDPHSSTSSSSHDNQVNNFRSNPNQAFHQYNNNNGGGDDDYRYFDQPQEKMNEEAWPMPMVYSGSNDFFVPDFSDSILTNEEDNNNNNYLALIQNDEGCHHHEAVNSVSAAVVKKSQLKRKSAAAASKSSPESDPVDHKDSNADVSTAKNPKKKPRVVSRPDHVQKMKNKKKVAEPRRRRKQKLDNNGDDEGNMTTMRPDEELEEEGSFVDDDDDHTASKKNGNKKTAAAMDGQSLYARKRRERINERLKILQNLVPNGTKVDISTMLEEAVIYVKFLQLQIKLLSSEDMWMYAPIAYNGMDIGRLSQILPL